MPQGTVAASPPLALDSGLRCCLSETVVGGEWAVGCGCPPETGTGSHSSMLHWLRMTSASYELGSRGPFPRGGYHWLEGSLFLVGCRIWRVCVCVCVGVRGVCTDMCVCGCVCLHRGVVQLGGSRPFRLVPVAGAPGVPVPIGWLGWA